MSLIKHSYSLNSGIQLHESLLGCHFTIDFLNGRRLPISYDEIIKPDDDQIFK